MTSSHTHTKTNVNELETAAHVMSKRQYNPTTDLFLLEHQQSLQQRQPSTDRAGRPVLRLVRIVMRIVAVRTDLVGSHSWHASQHALRRPRIVVQWLQLDRFVAPATRSALATARPITQAQSRNEIEKKKHKNAHIVSTHVQH